MTTSLIKSLTTTSIIKNGVLLLKVGYDGDTIGEDNIIEIKFIILKKDVPI